MSADPHVVAADQVTRVYRTARGRGTAIAVVSHDTDWLDSLAHRTLRM